MQPLVRGWSWTAGVGHRDMSAFFGRSYWYGHAGLSYAAGAMSLHLTYTQTDHTARAYFGDERASDVLVGAVIWKIGGH